MDSIQSSTFVAHLAIMAIPASILAQIVSALVRTIMPATSSYDATNNQEMLVKLMISGMRFTAILVMPIFIGAFLLLDEAMGIWVGSSYLFLFPYALAILLGRGFMLTTATIADMQKGMGKIRIYGIINWIGLVFVPVAIILSMIYLQIDPYISVSTGLVGGYIVSGVLFILHSLKLVAVKLRDILYRVYIQPLSPLVVVVPIILLLFKLGVRSIEFRDSCNHDCSCFSLPGNYIYNLIDA